MRIHLVESIFATRRYDRCREESGSLAKAREEALPIHAVLRGYEIASLLALGPPSGMAAQLDALIARIEEQPETFTTDWTFDGTLHFLRQEETLAPRRADLILLFESLQAPDRDAIVAGLRQLEGRLGSG